MLWTNKEDMIYLFHALFLCAFFILSVFVSFTEVGDFYTQTKKWVIVLIRFKPDSQLFNPNIFGNHSSISVENESYMSWQVLVLSKQNLNKNDR